MAHWLESQLNDQKQIDSTSFVKSKLSELNNVSVLTQLKSIIENHPDLALESIHNLVENTSNEKIKQVIQTLTDKLNKVISETGGKQPQQYY
jgi:hypothetical protein